MAQNRIRVVAMKQGRKLSWVGEQIGYSRSAFDWKLDHDAFTPEQQARIAVVLGVPVADLFPDAEPERVAV